jgi:Ni/Fe-hydrogenase 1 B-type cytochrome subunit
MWLLLGFAVHHVYSAVLMALVEKRTMDSIFTGYKWVSKKDLGPQVSHGGGQ